MKAIVETAVERALKRLMQATECSCPPSLNAVRYAHWQSCRAQWRHDVETLKNALENGDE